MTNRRWLLATALMWLAAGPAVSQTSVQTPQDFESSIAGPVLQTLGLRPAFKLEPGLESFLKENGYEVDPPGIIVHLPSGMDIPPTLLARAGLAFSPEGRLVYMNGGMEVERRHIPGVLGGLLQFAEAYSVPAEEAGAALRAWGFPIVYDGRRLLDPDGSATYFGRMIYQGMRKAKGGPKPLSGERLSRSLDLVAEAFGQGFGKSAPDIAHADLERAWSMLLREEVSPGETPLGSGPTVDPGEVIVSAKKGIMEEASSLRGKGAEEQRKELKGALYALEALEKYHYYPELDLSQVPPPSPIPGAQAQPQMIPPARFLPKLLSLLDKINGKPLKPAQAEALVKSFPMGETVWRMGAQDLWRAGLTGKGVKVAVIDTGVAPHPELEGAVRSADNFTRERGPDSVGFHATHVAGTIHALAPDAEIRSYKTLSGEAFETNPRLALDDEELMNALGEAVDKAVKDGNQVINLSLGGPGRPSGALARKVEEYARQGVIFVIAAGNGGPGGISSPAVAASALTAGALTAAGRPATFSSWGDNFDAEKLKAAIKKVFMAPGTNIVSTLKGGGYGTSSGTSMAAPHLSGAVALLVQGLKDMGGFTDPAALGSKVREVLESSGHALSRDKVPPEASPEQEFIVVDPGAAWKRMQAAA